MKTYGYVKYPNIRKNNNFNVPYIQKGKTLYGWNRGKLISNKDHIIFEDVEGAVHVVNRSIFYS